VKQLVEHSPFPAGDGTVFIGDLKTKLYVLNPKTGDLLDEFPKEGDADAFAVKDEEDEHKAIEGHLQKLKTMADVRMGTRMPRDAIYIARREYKLSIYDAPPKESTRPMEGKATRRKWTITYAEFGDSHLSRFTSVDASVLQYNTLERGPLEIKHESTPTMLSVGFDGRVALQGQNGAGDVWSRLFPRPAVSVLNVMQLKPSDAPANDDGISYPLLLVPQKEPPVETISPKFFGKIKGYVAKLFISKAKWEEKMMLTKDIAVYVGKNVDGSLFALSESRFPYAVRDVQLANAPVEMCMWDSKPKEKPKDTKPQGCLIGRHFLVPTLPFITSSALNEPFGLHYMHEFSHKSAFQKLLTFLGMGLFVVVAVALALRPKWCQRRVMEVGAIIDNSVVGQGTRRRGRRGRGTQSKRKDMRQELFKEMDVVKDNSDGLVQLQVNSLTVYNEILGYGSHGTVVYRGRFEKRDVAVKRLLLDYYEIAEHEVKLLQDSDNHPNVVRYYCKESCEQFAYIAIEFCPATLFDVVERPDLYPYLCEHLSKKQLLMEIAQGLSHLHSLNLVHRDLKPQNILISAPRYSRKAETPHAHIVRQGPKALISDLGLSKRLESDQSSFGEMLNGMSPPANGTIGWRAPECLVAFSVGLDLHGRSIPARITKSIDVFTAGCLFYYVLTGGQHPFGDRFSREGNVVAGLWNISELYNVPELMEQGTVEEARDLIQRMIARNPNDRPTTQEILNHPFFWDAKKRLSFLMDASDRFDVEPRPPIAPALSPLLQTLEQDANTVIGLDWRTRVDRALINDMGRRRGYDGKSIRDLLRAMRNKRHHYHDLSDELKQLIGEPPAGYIAYFTKRFPRLFIHVYRTISNEPELCGDMAFAEYFGPTAPSISDMVSSSSESTIVA
jgi:serine/threonine-protein kinase/endoribonuclease IRE1